MSKVEIYTKSWCPYSTRARELLDSKGVAYEHIDVTTDTVREAEMVKRANRTSVPQVFIGGVHIGGSDELAALEADGDLDALLEAAATVAA